MTDNTFPFGSMSALGPTVAVTLLVCLAGCFAADYCKDAIGKVDKCYSSVHVIGDRSFVRPKTPSAAESHCR